MRILPDKMAAAILHGPGDLRYEDCQTPTPRADEVLVRVSVNGLCGSDIHFFERGELGPFKVTSPYIPGHEACGVVVRSADGAESPAIGQRVAIEPGIPCRRCELCKTGRYNLCADVVFLSAPPVNGTFAEYVAVAADFAHSVPNTVTDEAAAFVEPVSVGIQACKRAGLKAGDSIAILGAGPIGLVTLLVARAFGAADVFVVDILENRVKFAQELGATDAIDAGHQSPVERIRQATDGRGIDVVFDTSGSSDACRLAPQLAKRGGVVTLVGWPETSDFAYPVELILEKELDVRGVNRYCNTYPRAISLLASGQINVEPLVSHRFPFEQVVDAFRFASEHRASAIKIMVTNDAAAS